MKRIETTLSDPDYLAWKAFCQETGKGSAHLLREFIQHSTISSSTASSVTETVKISKNKKITVRFTDHQFDMILKKVALEGYQTPTNWIRSLVLNNLHQEAVLTDKEIQTLEKLSYQLWAIGHNLNQATRALNIDPQDSEALKLDMIEALRELNLETRKAFAELISKNKSRWHKKVRHQNKPA